ncbi:MAG: nucleotidyl transferase AbiEii/AbiGii toxin family protein [Pseudonocardia sp.]|nr:nucleotidyl transferase AbiEii/AbiGii toxin family protein [Pseudonocardia sp.]
MSTEPPGLRSPVLVRVLESAARLQSLVPDAVLVGGSAAALYAAHRSSYDHDHVLTDLAARFDTVLEALESQDGWVTNRVVPGKIILGELGGIETGVRQLIRRTPLELATVALPSGHDLTVPTPEETLRVKAFLLVRRNQTRDFLDVAALTDRFGTGASALALADIDRYYADQHGTGDGVASQVARQLADPRPKDTSTIRELRHYRDLAPRWHDWNAVVDTCRALAAAMAEGEGT